MKNQYKPISRFFDYIKRVQLYTISRENCSITYWPNNCNNICPRLYDESRPIWIPVLYLDWRKDLPNLEIEEMHKFLIVLSEHDYIYLKERKMQVSPLDNDKTSVSMEDFYGCTMLYYSLSPKGFRTSIPIIKNEVPSK